MPGNTELLTQSILSLLLVLAIMVGLLYASKWFMQRRPRGGRRLRFIEAMAVGNKEKLVLVEVDGRQLLLGVSPQHVNLISQVDDPDSQPFSHVMAHHQATESATEAQSKEPVEETKP